MLGYWGDAALTESSVIDGWMLTGDIATIDQDGHCEIAGRVKDMIIRGGENISPREIEDFLFTHPGIDQAQVFGIHDEKYGEVVCAWVVASDPELSEQSVRQFCEGQIAHFKVPKHIRIKDTFPMTVTGKPQKFLMREAMVKELDQT